MQMLAHISFDIFLFFTTIFGMNDLYNTRLKQSAKREITQQTFFARLIPPLRLNLKFGH